MLKTYSTLANAKRALKAISTEALKHACDLIEETPDGKYAFSISAAEAYEATLKEVWEEEERTDEDRNYVFQQHNPVETLKLEVEQQLAADMKEDGASVSGYETHGFINCPSCGIHLCNGIGEHLQEVNGKYIKHEEFEYSCLGCGAEFGPAIPAKKASDSTRALSATQRDTMKTSLKLDRTIVSFVRDEAGLISDVHEYKNAYQLWLNNPMWMTSAQQDTLTAKLYKAAKEGVKLSVEINGRLFELQNV